MWRENEDESPFPFIHKTFTGIVFYRNWKCANVLAFNGKEAVILPKNFREIEVTVETYENFYISFQ